LIGQHFFVGCLSLHNFSISFQNPPKIPSYLNQQKPFFPHAITDIFNGWPFDLIWIFLGKQNLKKDFFSKFILDYKWKLYFVKSLFDSQEHLFQISKLRCIF
jgi:hypothetical protein